MKYSLKAFDYILPEEFIAHSPVHPRDRAKLLIYNRGTKVIIDDYFYNLPNYLNPETTLVVNNSKVEECRYIFGVIEVFMLSKSDPYTCRALVRPGRKFKLGKVVQLTDQISAEVLAIDDEGLRTLRFNVQLDDEGLSKYAHVVLPPYMPQDDKLASEYQTVFADPLGS
jgi:S-adenosylmethionine:tRNA ribosyltransferase-isomerase